MRRPARGLVAVPLAAALLAGCGSARPSRYYTLDLREGAPAAASALPVRLVVGRIAAPALYRDGRLVYRWGETRTGVYDHDRWSEPPADLLQALLVRRLRASGRYASVQALRGAGLDGDRLLIGQLHELGEVTVGEGPQAAVVGRVVLELDLVDPRSGELMWSHLYRHDEPVAAREVEALVAAVNRNVRRALDDIDAALAAHFAAAGPSTPPAGGPPGDP